MQEPEHQEGIGAGADEQVLIGEIGGLGATGIYQHHLAPARADGLEPLPNGGRRHDAAVGRRGVGAEDQHEIGAIDVGDGQKELVAEHRERHEHVREVVH